MLNCYELKFPQLSESTQNSLIKLAEHCKPDVGFDVINLQELSKDYQNWVKYHEVTNTKRTSYIQFEMNQEFNSLIHKEMTDELFPFSRVNFYFQLVTGGEKLMPHRDPSRTLSILYNISADGAITHWHEDYTKDTNKYLYAIGEVSDPIQSVRMKPFTWYVFNNDAPHSVTEITKDRIAITSRLNADDLDLPDYKSFIDKYSHLLEAGDGFEPPIFRL